MRLNTTLAAAAAILAIASPLSAKDKNTGTQAQELDPNGRGAISGIGIESRDIDGMANMVLRDIMQRPDIMNRPEPPRIILDHNDFRNESMQRFNAKLVTDTLRSALNRTAAGKVRFINRANLERIQQERELKRQGQTDVGTLGTNSLSGSDYFMTANMVSLESRDGKSGIQQRRTQVTFELIEAETGDIVYTSEPYAVLRAAAEDVVYR